MANQQSKVTNLADYKKSNASRLARRKKAARLSFKSAEVDDFLHSKRSLISKRGWVTRRKRWELRCSIEEFLTEEDFFQGVIETLPVELGGGTRKEKAVWVLGFFYSRAAELNLEFSYDSETGRDFRLPATQVEDVTYWVLIRPLEEIRWWIEEATTKKQLKVLEETEQVVELALERLEGA